MVVGTLDGRVVRANRAFCALTGYEEHELTGRRFSDFTHPDDRDDDADDMRRLVAGEIDVLHHRKRYVRPSGEVVWAELHCSTLNDRRGRATYMTAQVEDITARKRAEDALRDSEQRYRTLVAHLPDTVVVDLRPRLPHDLRRRVDAREARLPAGALHREDAARVAARRRWPMRASPGSGPRWPGCPTRSRTRPRAGSSWRSRSSRSTTTRARRSGS